MEAIAILRNVPTSPRKTRLVADLIRGMQVMRALSVLKFQPQHASEHLYKVLRSAVANYEQKFPNEPLEDLYITTLFVNEGRMLKRVQPAPQGRAHRIRKRSNHITIKVGNPAGLTIEQAVETETTEA
jgi:large subunit ribosomal protein L22